MMIRYRKILELYDKAISLSGISTSTGNSRQKMTEIIQLAEKKLVTWIEEFYFQKSH